MQVANRFVGAAVAALSVVLAGCGGGDAEGPEPEAAAFLEDAADDEQAAQLQALMAEGPVAASSCRPGRPCRLKGSVVTNGRADFNTPGCSTLTTTVSGGAIVNANFTGTFLRAGRYNVRVSTGTFKFITKTSALTCQTPGGPITIPAPPPTTIVVAARTGNVTVTSDGRNLTVVGTLLGAPPPGCTGGNRFNGADIGLSNPLVTLKGTMTCNIAGATVKVTHSVKLVGAP